MNKLLLAMLCAGTLAACTPQDEATTVADIQTATNIACGFVPTAASIAALFTASPIAVTASQAASLLCSAVTHQSAQSITAKATAPGADRTYGQYKGVAIVGHWTR